MNPSDMASRNPKPKPKAKDELEIEACLEDGPSLLTRQLLLDDVVAVAGEPVVTDYGPHQLKRRFKTRPEPDLSCRLVHEHAEAADRCAVPLSCKEKRRQRRFVNKVDDQLAAREPGAIDPGDDRIVVGAHGRLREALGIRFLEQALCHANTGHR